MRLVCPNCDAEYEVDERVIPDAGRDVQCSNCGHAWFQHPEGFDEKTDEGAAPETPDHGGDTGESDDADSGAEAAIDAMIRDESDAEGVADDPQKEAEPLSEAEEQVADDEVYEDYEDAADEGDQDGEDQGDAENHTPDQTPDDNDRDDASDGDPPPTTRELDEGVRDILRQEADRETQARDDERGGLETQDELGLSEEPEPAQAGQAAQERMARLRGLDVDDTNAAGGSGARRDLLPDIEEINSSLAPIGSNDVGDDFAEPETRKGGFSRGFAIMLLLAVLIIVLYIYAPWVSEKVPALAPFMDSYVGLINAARGWLDQLVQAALSKLQ